MRPWPGSISWLALFTAVLAAAVRVGPATATEPVYFASPGLVFPSTGDRRDAEVGDFNGDGRPDVIVACWISDGFSFLAGDGAGQLEPEVRTPLPASVLDFAVAELTGDTHLDLVAIFLSSLLVSVYPGVGDGTFAAPMSTTLGSFPGNVVGRMHQRDGWPPT